MLLCLLSLAAGVPRGLALALAWPAARSAHRSVHDCCPISHVMLGLLGLHLLGLHLLPHHLLLAQRVEGASPCRRRGAGLRPLLQGLLLGPQGLLRPHVPVQGLLLHKHPSLPGARHRRHPG
jgi:hypothetical protein